MGNLKEQELPHFLKKVKAKLLYITCNSTYRSICKRIENTCIQTLVCWNVHSNIIPNGKWKQPKSPWADWWMSNKMYFISSMEYFSTVQGDGVLTQGTKMDES